MEDFNQKHMLIGGFSELNQNQVVTVLGKDSEWYDKAIFIIRKEVIQSQRNKDLSKEADMIISNYAKKNGLAVEHTQSIDKVLNVILTICICILGICLLQL